MVSRRRAPSSLEPSPSTFLLSILLQAATGLGCGDHACSVCSIGCNNRVPFLIKCPPQPLQLLFIHLAQLLAQSPEHLWPRPPFLVDHRSIRVKLLYIPRDPTLHQSRLLVVDDTDWAS